MPKPTVVADVPVVGQGVVVEVSTDDGTTYTPFKGLSGVPQVGSEGAFIEVQDIDELVKRFGKGTRTPPPWELVAKRIGSDALQDTLIAKARDDDDLDPVKMRITYRTGDIAEFDLILNGFYMDTVEQGDNLQMFALKGQQTGAVALSKVV